MYARAGCALLARLRIWIPNRVEEYEDWSDLVLRGDTQKLIEAALETFGVLPEQVVQVNAHRIHAETLSPTKFQIDSFRIERVCLPHLELVNGAGRVVVAADQPRLPRVPIAGLLLRPSLVLRCERGDGEQDPNGDYLNQSSQG